MAGKPSRIKQNFWILVFIFSVLAVSGLIVLWENPPAVTDHSSMMRGTMGSMMAQESRPSSIADLFGIAKEESMMSGMDMAGHHDQSSLMGKIHFATTVIIVTLIPVIIGLLSFLLALWL